EQQAQHLHNIIITPAIASQPERIVSNSRALEVVEQRLLLLLVQVIPFQRPLFTNKRVIEQIFKCIKRQMVRIEFCFPLLPDRLHTLSPICISYRLSLSLSLLQVVDSGAERKFLNDTDSFEQVE